MVVGLGAWWLGWRDALALGGGWLSLQALLALWWPWLSFPRWGWRLDPDVLRIRRGVLFRTEVAIPTARIQHVDIRQGPLDQLVGLARLQVHTASGLGADGWIPGLTPGDAEALRVHLTRGLQRGDGV